MKKLLTALILVVIAFSAISCASDLERTSNIKSIQMSYIQDNVIMIELGTTLNDKLEIIVSDIESFNPQNIELMSEDKSIATIKYTKYNEDGRIYLYYDVYGASAGETHIYAKEKDGTLETEKRKIIVYSKSQETTEKTIEETADKLPETIPETTSAEIETLETTPQDAEPPMTEKVEFPVSQETVPPETEIPVDTIPIPVLETEAESLPLESIAEDENPLINNAVFWAPTGKKIHMMPNCSSFNEEGIYYCGTFEEGCTVRANGWCGICSSLETDGIFNGNKYATADAINKALTYQDYLSEYEND